MYFIFQQDESFFPEKLRKAYQDIHEFQEKESHCLSMKNGNEYNNNSEILSCADNITAEHDGNARGSSETFYFSDSNNGRTFSKSDNSLNTCVSHDIQCDIIPITYETSCNDLPIASKLIEQNDRNLVTVQEMQYSNENSKHASLYGSQLVSSNSYHVSDLSNQPFLNCDNLPKTFNSDSTSTLNDLYHHDFGLTSKSNDCVEKNVRSNAILSTDVSVRDTLVNCLPTRLNSSPTTETEPSLCHGFNSTSTAYYYWDSVPRHTRLINTPCLVTESASDSAVTQGEVMMEESRDILNEVDFSICADELPVLGDLSMDLCEEEQDTAHALLTAASHNGQYRLCATTANKVLSY